MTQNISKKILISCLSVIAPALLFGQEVAAAAPASQSSGVDFNLVLLIVATFLLLPIYITGKAFLLVVKDFMKKDNGNAGLFKKAGLSLLLLFAYQFTQAQADPTTAAMATASTTSSMSWLLLTVIIAESIVIVFFSWLINSFLKTYSAANEAAATGAPAKQASWWSNLWDKANSFKPIEEEGSIDTGHSYDGIRELDNVTPPWFITAFALTIVFAVIYLYRYHVSQSAPLQDEEYTIEVADAEVAKAKFLATQTNSVDENTITMLDASEISQGKAIFTKTCSPCHGPSGGSMPGGVGPNLTDGYWIHGGSLQSIFKTIKYGWPEKGMISWKDQLTAKQIAQLTCFIASIKGSNPPGAKDPQGELYKEEKAGVKADSTIKDSVIKPVVKKAAAVRN